jgi:acetyltransferase-like isoleucine patch superfamily enzyme
MFGGGIDVTVGDLHSIVDVETGKRINPAADVSIGERVWIGQNALSLKGAAIGAGSVIGACSIVTGAIPENSVAVGNPARVIRSGATWRHDLI